MNSVPPADSLEPTPPTPKGRHSHRLRRNLLIALGVVVGVYIAFMAVAITTDVVLSNELLKADFQNGSAPFETGADDNYAYDIVDGKYQITSKTSDPGPTSSLAFFERTAYAVNMSAEIDSVFGDGFFGVGCYSGEGGDDGGYLLLASTDGGVGLIKKVHAREPEVIAMNEEATVPASNVRLKLSCVNPVAGSTVPLKGYVDGEEVINGSDPHGLDGFTVGGLEFAALSSGADVRFTSAEAVVSDKDS